MENATETILGISPGTTWLGIAVLRNGELIDWRVYRPKYTWSKAKHQRVMTYLNFLIDRYEVTGIALNPSAGKKNTVALKELYSGIRATARSQKLALSEYSFQELVRYTCTENIEQKKDLPQAIIQHFPELTALCLKEKKNWNAYYIKMFEAVAAASALHTVLHCTEA